MVPFADMISISVELSAASFAWVVLLVVALVVDLIAPGAGPAWCGTVTERFGPRTRAVLRWLGP